MSQTVTELDAEFARWWSDRLFELDRQPEAGNGQADDPAPDTTPTPSPELVTLLPYTYRATVLSRHDGDTFSAELVLGFGLFFRTSVRVYGIDTHELDDPDMAKRELALAAKSYAEALAPVGSQVIVRPFNEKKPSDKFGGRVDMVVTLPDGRSFAEEMVKAGKAVVYYGGKR